MDFTEKVSALARSHHISINALRLKTGIGNGTLQGHADPRFSTVVKVSKFFNVPLDYFLDDEDSEPAAGLILTQEETDLILAYRTKSDDAKDIVASSLGVKRQDTGLRSSSKAV